MPPKPDPFFSALAAAIDGTDPKEPMPRTLHIDVELTVSDGADPTDVADWLFSLLADADDDAWHEHVDSVDGTTPNLRDWQ